MDYPLDGGSKLLISGKVREVACEVLFEQDREEKSVSTTILDSIIQVRIRLIFSELAGESVVSFTTSTCICEAKNRFCFPGKEVSQRLLKKHGSKSRHEFIWDDGLV